MILVNNPGSWAHVYPPLRHAEWHGWTPTDFIFPFFLFIVGVAMTFSLPKPENNRALKRTIYIKIIRRTLIIYALGLFLSGFPYFDFSTIRVVGVLPRIAIVYFFAALITVNTNLKGQIWTTSGLLVLYWGLMKLVPVPGFGAGNLSVEGNLAAFIDNKLLHGHMWKESWDPEGLLSTIPAIATALTGVLTGRFLQSGLDKRDIVGWLFVGGWYAILIGLFGHIWFPINKSLWTSSFVIFTSGAALQFLGVCYWLIEVKKYRKWAFFAIVFGMNSITVFMLSGLLARIIGLVKVDAAGAISVKTWIYESLFASWFSAFNGSLAFALVTVLFWLGIMTILHRKKIFIKI